MKRVQRARCTLGEHFPGGISGFLGSGHAGGEGEVREGMREEPGTGRERLKLWSGDDHDTDKTQTRPGFRVWVLSLTASRYFG